MMNIENRIFEPEQQQPHQLIAKSDGEFQQQEDMRVAEIVRQKEKRT